MIKTIEVKKLFGRFNYEVTLKEGRVTVLTGPNGFGKSTLFTLLEAVSKGYREPIFSTPFQSFSLVVDEEKISLEKTIDKIIINGNEYDLEGFASAKKCSEWDALSQKVGRIEIVGSRRLLSKVIKGEKDVVEYVEFLRNIPLRVAKAHRSIEGAKRAELLVELLSEKLTFKRVELQGGEMYFYDDDGNALQFSQLSAGEIQLTAFYVELLFSAMDGSLMLVEEPENSLHIIWQFGLVEEVEKICTLTATTAIIATHSPQILNGNADIQVDLGEQYDG